MVATEIVPLLPVQSSPVSADQAKWKYERDAFFRMLGTLLQTHCGQYVAVHEGRVVGSGSDLIPVALKAYAQFGYQPIYVDLVAEHPLPAVRVPHVRLARDKA
jgi:hypothetical protein